MNLLRLFGRKWIFTTLLVIAAMGVMVRLGYWQLDRLEKRRAFNARVQAQIDQPPLELTPQSLTPDLEGRMAGMEYRQVAVTGEYDFEAEVVLRNQAWNDQIGVNLITPLHIEGSDQSVLINRGWIPFEDFTSGNMAKYAENGQVEVRGVIRASQARPEIGWRKDVLPRPGEAPLEAWNMVNVEGIASQTPYSLLPVYIQQAPDPEWTGLPYRSLPALELTEGPHLGYAIQWFIFAAILGIGYPIYVRREELNQSKPVKTSEYLRPNSTSTR
jgi:surfeit locus 1 family protein